MGKRERRTFTEDFKREAVRLTQTSGRTIGQVADDLGIGLSTLTRWKRFAGSHPQLPFHQIDTGDFLGHRMFDLQPCVHLDKIEFAVFIQEFNRTSARIPKTLNSFCANLTNSFACGVIKCRRNSFFPNLLVPAL